MNEKNCLNCDHVVVCRMWALASSLAFAADDVAAICMYFKRRERE